MRGGGSIHIYIYIYVYIYIYIYIYIYLYIFFSSIAWYSSISHAMVLYVSHSKIAECNIIQTNGKTR